MNQVGPKQAISQAPVDFTCAVNVANLGIAAEYIIPPTITLQQIFNQLQTDYPHTYPPSCQFYCPETKRLYASSSFYQCLKDILAPGENYISLELQFGEELETTLKQVQIEAPQPVQPQVQQLQQSDNREMEITIHIKAYDNMTQKQISHKFKSKQVAQDILSFVEGDLPYSQAEARIELDNIQGKLHKTLSELHIDETVPIIARIRFKGG